MLWLMTMGRRLNGVYAAFMLVAFMMGVAGALQAPTSVFSAARWAQPFWVGLFYTVNAIAGILVSLALAKRPIAGRSAAVDYVLLSDGGGQCAAVCL
jgi:SET family sugar efflux transporter-like MFS transporter